MRSLFVRVYLTVVGVLLAFALVGGWLAHRQLDREREQAEQTYLERLHGMAGLLERALPPSDAPPEAQAAALRRWAQQLRFPLALESAQGERLATSPRFERRAEVDENAQPDVLPLSDGRRLLVFRPWRPRPGGPASQWAPLPNAPTLAVLFVVLFAGVALGAYPVVRRLTRRLEQLKLGVERFGQGDLQHRVVIDGQDEVAALAKAFNQSAEQVQALVSTQQRWAANASHELRSPLARLRMALALQQEGDGTPALRAEIAKNMRELDALIEELLLSSRLDAVAPTLQSLDLLGLAAEASAQTGVPMEGEWEPCEVLGEDRLLRRALTNLLENAKRYGGSEQSLDMVKEAQRVTLRVMDRGPGVDAAYREKIFEPFFRLPGHAEVAGGVGLGLALVRQIVRAHQGDVRCLARPGGGAVFELSLPLAPSSTGHAPPTVAGR